MAQPSLISNCDGASFASLPLAPPNRVPQTYAALPGPRFCVTVALDLGTATGWGIRGHDDLTTSGTISLRPGPSTAAGCATCASPTG